MMDFNSSITRRTRVTEALMWSGAALVMFGAHAWAVAWMLRTDPVVAADNSPPAAIMIEIAAASESMQAEKDEISPDMKTADERLPQSEQKQRETPQEQVTAQLIEPDEVEPVEETKDKDKTVVLKKAEVQLPQPKPEKKPVEKPKEKPKEKKPRPRNQQAAADSKAMRQAEVRAQPSDRMAAAQTASGVSSMSPANWQSLLMAHLEHRKRYPSDARARGDRGTVYVRFSIDSSGNVLSASLVRSSGFSELDQEVVSLVHRASPVPAPPPGTNRTITVPVRFSAN
jgi:protein TonB